MSAVETDIIGVILELHAAYGHRDMGKLGRVVKIKVDKVWEILSNPTNAELTGQAEQWGAIVIRPFSWAIFYNGWLAGMVNPQGGEFAAGEGANPETFAAAIREHIRIHAPLGQDAGLRVRETP